MGVAALGSGESWEWLTLGVADAGSGGTSPLPMPCHGTSKLIIAVLKKLKCLTRCYCRIKFVL